MLPNPFANKSYLVVDDFADMRSNIRSMLRPLGATDIAQARNGAEAVDQMKMARFDVVICDYNLGAGKNGQQVLEEARHHNLLGIDGIFIMVTAENTRDMVMVAVEYEPDSYLSKPFTKELLRTRLARLIARKSDLAPVNQALSQGRYAQAIELVDDLLGRRPKNLADLRKLKAEICFKAGRYDEAARIYDQVLLERELAWAHFGKAKVLYATKEYATAVTLFQGLVDSQADFIAAYDWLAKCQLAMNLPDSAEETLLTATRLSPRAIKRQQALAELALSNGRADVAETAFDKAVSLSEFSVFKHPSLYSGLAKSKSANQKHDEALQVVERLGRAFEGEVASFYQAATTSVIRRNQGDTDSANEAMHQAEEALRAAGDHHAGHLSVEMARVLSHAGDKEKAAQYLQAAVANNHDDETFLDEVAGAYREAGIAKSPEAVIAGIRKRVIETNNRGTRLIREGEVDAAIELLQQASAEVPGNRTVTFNVARALVIWMEKNGVDAERVRRLQEHLNRARRLAPDDPRLRVLQSQIQRLAIQFA